MYLQQFLILSLICFQIAMASFRHQILLTGRDNCRFILHIDGQEKCSVTASCGDKISNWGCAEHYYSSRWNFGSKCESWTNTDMDNKMSCDMAHDAECNCYYGRS